MTNYNINQMNLSISTDWKPQKNSPAILINQVVEKLEINDPYITGRPREYDLRSLLKLILFAYTKGIFSSRRINELAEDSLSARWLTQEQAPSYRTICRFRISDDAEKLIQQSIINLNQYLRTNNYIDEITFIDGTKILADANKYSFVWLKNTIRFDKMNRAAIIDILAEMKHARLQRQIPKGSDINLEMLDEIIIRLENQLTELNTQIKNEKPISPNPKKRKRRKIKALKNHLKQRRAKMANYDKQNQIFKQRNSYSKTDHDATFMRCKEDPMRNGQLKPAYNLQIATSNQFVTGFGIYQNPTDTRTLSSFLEQQSTDGTLGKYIVADAGYGSENNYRFIEDNLPNHIAIIPYSTMLREQSRKWRSDDRKVMNWEYHEQDDYYIDPNGVRFNFNAYRKRTDKYGLTRDFKEYKAEVKNQNWNFVSKALTKRGHLRRINVNPAWEYYKAKQRKLLSESETSSIYARRKIDVESVFGHLKGYLKFTRFSVRGISKVKREAGIVLMAMNIRKLASLVANFLLLNVKMVLVGRNYYFFQQEPFILRSYVTAPFASELTMSMNFA
ncbi:IS1182 family transposase [Lactobacillus sp. Sy-1]|uniref:IS1182 family transposase n=1 Tax=Lactobacillus sp. Sy-1 TaxID=2109645 RepID=UPI001C5B0E19|nr:IS1182 family transposase [Lactobacillus sp. Sy-1]MBW1606399.1 IS1182 family transposase [Lactobacillus sp. Sy-1]